MAKKGQGRKQNAPRPFLFSQDNEDQRHFKFTEDLQARMNLSIWIEIHEMLKKECIHLGEEYL